ncbi:SAV_2336 N-terminal domain-related protein [Micromonospora sp. DT62]|uniref:SAV_2336 N-terminal domain-related protein n=1 Tax=Micromonospora sp. DT62 TaxID=3416521 RepID=UPI003CF0A600
MTIDRLHAAVVAAGGDPTPRELAEALWLAQHLRAPAPTTHPPPKAPASPAPGTAPTGGPEPDVPVPADDPEPPPAPLPPPAPTPAPTSLYVPPPEPGTMTAAEVVVPRSATLSDRLGFQRSLRPLMRRVPCPRVDVLDEEATVRAVAEHMLVDRPWPAVTMPSTERWLDVAVVVDWTASMTLWRDLATGLVETLTASGIFRQVSRWRLHRGAGVGAAALSSWRGEARRPAELVDPTGRRVVVVVSDCVDQIWHTGAAGALLRRWARHGPVSILQPLPERMWSRTGARTVAGLLSAPRPGAPNTDLRFTAFDGMPVQDGTLVPVLELSPRWLGRWARLLAGATAVTSAVTPVTGERTRTGPGREGTPPSPGQRVRHFRSSASPGAFRLAGYVAMTEPVLPVIRYIQQAMFRPAPPSQLAEVLLSGLLRVVDARAGRYRFVDGVQPLLLDTLARSDLFRAGELLEELSRSVQARVGVAREHFTALTPGPGRPGLVPDSLPFAVINTIGRARLDRVAARAPVRAEPAGAATAAAADVPSPADPLPAAPKDPGPATSDDPAVATPEAVARPAADLADLLSPHRAVVPFVGRRNELATLERWCEEPGTAVRVVVGGPGQGKTRLVRELVGRRRARWRDASSPLPAAVDAGPDDGGLVVVDRAETRTDEVLEELARAARNGTALRLLLIARAAGDWWQELRRTDPWGLIREATVQRLDAPWPPGRQRQTALRHAVLAIAGALDAQTGTRHWRDRASAVHLPDVDDERFGAPVALHLTALRILVRSVPGPPPPVTVADVTAVLLARERRYAEATAVAARISYARAGQLDGYLAAAALYGASTAADAHEVVRRIRPGDTTDRTILHRLANWLHELYPGADGEYWGPVEPDDVGNGLAVAAALVAPTLVTDVLPYCTPEQARRAVTVLGPACHRHPALAGPLWHVVRDQPALLLSLLQQTRSRTSAPPPALVARLRLLVQDPETPLPMLRAVAGGLYDPGALFADQPVARSTALIEGARRLGDSDRHLPWLAEALRHHRQRLTASGSHDVLTVLTEEIDLRVRTLDRAGTPWAVARLASALDAQADALQRAGLTVQALSATNRSLEYYGQLPSRVPDGRLGLLCAAQTRRARLLGELGRADEGVEAALKAVAHAYDLVSAGLIRAAPPADAGGLPDVARLVEALDERTRLHRLGAASAAAVAARDDCVRLAGTLDALAVLHRLAGDGAAALKAQDDAVRLYRWLAAADPVRRPALARALLRQAMDLAEVGSPQTALPVGDEAVRIHRDLAAGRDAEALVELATALYCRAVHLHDLERHGDAAAALREVVVIHRDLATADPARYAADLATMLRHQAGLLAETGDAGAAIDALDESCAVLGRVFRDDVGNVTLRARLASTHQELAELWERAGDRTAADRHRVRARRLTEGPADRPGS